MCFQKHPLNKEIVMQHTQQLAEQATFKTDADICREQLNLSSDYVLVHLSNADIPNLVDASVVTDALFGGDKQDYNYSRQTAKLIDEAINNSCFRVKLAPHLRIAGMARVGQNHRVYGVVDFSGR
jgi:hypothetical protein